MADIIFYTNPQSRGQIVRFMLEELGEPYETALLDYGTTMKSADYLAINPMGKVPAIRHLGADGKGRVVTEAAAICAYLADAFPAAGLAPGTDDRADYYRWLFFAAGPVEAAVTNKAMGFVLPEGRERSAGYGSLDDTLDTLETAVTGRSWICGGTFTAADVYVGAQISWGLMFGTIEARPAFVDYWNLLKERPAYLRASELDDALMPKQG